MGQLIQDPVVRFATFEVDLSSGELRKQGRRIKLQGQPFRVLVMLLKHPGEVATREELQSQLWPSDTFVDFDNGLNASINRLREALGDSAENARFVETLPRRGYRFIAPLEGANTQQENSSGVHQAAPQPSRMPRNAILFAACALLAVTAFLLHKVPGQLPDDPEFNSSRRAFAQP